ncbi:hypothetical protein AB0O32_37830 [Streptomyces rubiginosohelvolus]|uniref:hypothetical protein n=1 Tax=Streptomyces rubiginosohelvolus TaxID=67362 RepID=UPI00341BAC2F
MHGIRDRLAQSIALVIAKVVDDLALEGVLQESLGELLEPSALAGRLQALGVSPAHQRVMISE